MQEERFVLFLVNQIRHRHSRLGVRKLHYLLKERLECTHIKIGRDKLFSIMRKNQMLVRKKIRQTKTTNSRHWYKKYPNLIGRLDVIRPNQVWVSDITYLMQAKGFMYLSLVTDAYSRKIVGYNLAHTLEAIHSVKALQMALSNNENREGLIHHSDRGIQYCSYEYVKLLRTNNIEISMTQKGDPLENAIAERVNGILKQEYLEDKITSSQSQIEQIIHLYNSERPHLSCQMLTPEQAHQGNGILEKKWKNYYNPQKVNRIEDVSEIVNF